MAQQIKTITSESLEATYRSYTPSQDGFTEDLMASNTIIPIVDLTATAAGTQTGQNLQTAWDSTTSLNQVNNTTTTIVSGTGFYQVDLHFVYQPNGAVQPGGTIQINDGTVTRIKIWQASLAVTGASSSVGTAEDSFVVFLRSQDSLEAYSVSTNATLNVWTRQIADVNGVLVNPAGFTPQ